MHAPDLLYRLSRQRALELERDAAREQLLASVRPSLRAALARSLLRLAERLEPELRAGHALR